MQQNVQYTIKAQEQPLKAIFAKDYVFHIPPYQRPYSWETEQAGELLSDLFSALEENKQLNIDQMPPYFLGSIVLIQKDVEKPDRDVVDGQQRLITLTILLAVLRDLDSNSDLHEYIYQEKRDTEDIQAHYRLKLTKRDSPFFEKTIQEQGATLNQPNESEIIEAQENIQKNSSVFRKSLNDIPKEQREKLGKFLINCCYMVMVSVSNEEVAYNLFTVLNTRGVPLSHTDILKARIIGGILDEKDKETYTDKWEDVREEMQHDDFDSLFSDIRMILLKKPHRQHLSFDIMDAIFKKDKDKDKAAKKFIESLESMATIYEQVSQLPSFEEKIEDKDINRYLKYLNYLDNKNWRPLAILFFSKNENPSSRLEFVKALERLAYGFFIARTYLAERIQRYFTLLKQIENIDPIKDLDLEQKLKDAILSNFESTLPPKIQNPLLYRLNDILSQDIPIEYDETSIEHILPQKVKQHSQWDSWFPDDKHKEYLNKLGNLTLLPGTKNKGIKNAEFNVKIKKYKEPLGKNKTPPLALTQRILAPYPSQWTPTEIDERTERLVALLKEEWKL